MKAFGSDNYSSVHPVVIEELARVNTGHALPYGNDPYTAEAVNVLQAHFGPECDIRFVWNGTGANVVCLSALAQPWESVLCATTAHINNDECAAPEHIAGLKIVPIDTPDGKLTPELIQPYLAVQGFEHAAQPRVVSISNVTELGTVYTPEELVVLCDFAHAHGLVVHCDGARIANAAASLGVSLRALTADVGIDALSFGGTKNALMGAEAVVLFGSAQNRAIFMIRKSCGQLSSKMRYVAAQFAALYRGDVWLDCAGHANALTQRLAHGLAELGFAPTQQADANELFVVLPRPIIKPLQDEFHFYTWNESAGEVRFVTSWDNTFEEVEALLARVAEYAKEL